MVMMMAMMLEDTADDDADDDNQYKIICNYLSNAISSLICVGDFAANCRDHSVLPWLLSAAVAVVTALQVVLPVLL